MRLMGLTLNSLRALPSRPCQCSDAATPRIGMARLPLVCRRCGELRVDLYLDRNGMKNPKHRWFLAAVVTAVVGVAEAAAILHLIPGTGTENWDGVKNWDGELGPCQVLFPAAERDGGHSGTPNAIPCVWEPDHPTADAPAGGPLESCLVTRHPWPAEASSCRMRRASCAGSEARCPSRSGAFHCPPGAWRGLGPCVRAAILPGNSGERSRRGRGPPRSRGRARPPSRRKRNPPP